MQDFGKIVIGIIVFLGLLSIPVIVTQASGNANYDLGAKLAESIATSTNATKCIDSHSAEYMRVNHTDLLFDNRTFAVRDDADGDKGDVYWTDENGEEHLFSLNGTCLGCHDRDTFCNVCHDYTATKPNCWDCHDLSGVK